MIQYIQIQWTSESLQEAREIAKALVEKRWVACANVLPHVESFYLWEGKLEEGKEVKVFLKTSEANFGKVRDYILAHASYDVPEIAQLPITAANPEYVSWLLGCLKPR